MAVGDKEQEIFLGREFAQRREVSERTAQLVDDEVKSLLDEAYRRAHTLISQNRALLERVANALLERETLDREDLELLRQGKPLPPLPSPAAPPPPPPSNHDAKEPAPKTPPILGTPPPEPAGA